MNANFYLALQTAFAQAPQDDAIVTDQALHYTWQDVEHASAMLANMLEHAGLRVGDRIAAQVDKSVEGMLLYLACLRAGLVFVPLNTAYQEQEVRYFLENAAPQALVCRPEQFGQWSKLAFAAGVLRVFTLGANREGTLLDRAASFARQHTVAHIAPDALAAMIYTSGTTGRSKGAMLAHQHLQSNAEALNTHLHWQRNDVLLHALPMFHVHGLFIALHAALLAGSCIRWHGQFQADAVLRDLPYATVFMGVPTYYTRLLALPQLSHERVRNMRLFMSGSAPMLAETFNAWEARTGHRVLERYGMSETIILTANPYDEAQDGPRRAGTVGKPLHGVALRVVDGEQRPVAAGEVGHIQVKGPSVFSGYWRMPEKNAEEFTQDGFFQTGDLGQWDQDGYLTIVGRSKDLIISGGYNVYPAEIEDAINQLPGVEESAVVGVPHADFGEAGVALVVAKPAFQLDPQAILAQLKQQLANYKIPKHCEVLPALPRNAMGKVQKNILRQRYRDALRS